MTKEVREYIASLLERERDFEYDWLRDSIGKFSCAVEGFMNAVKNENGEEIRAAMGKLSNAVTFIDNEYVEKYAVVCEAVEQFGKLCEMFKN